MTRTVCGSFLACLLGSTLALTASAQTMQAPAAPAPAIQTLGIQPQGMLTQDIRPIQMGPSEAYGVDPAASGRRLEFTAALLFLQPTAGNLEYGTLVSPLPAVSPHWDNQSISPDFSAAFRIGMRATFANSVRDAQVNWTHLSTNDRSSFVADLTQFAGPYYEIGPDANAYNIGVGTVHFAYDAVNMDVGHWFHAGQPRQLRVFGGVQIARIGQNLSGDFSSFDGSTSTGYTTRSLFTGAGPRFGLTGQSYFGNFNLLGELAGSLIVGGQQSRMDYRTVDPSLPPANTPNLQSLSSPNAAQVVPGLDGRLGMGYAFTTRNCWTIKVDAGYQAVVYVDALNRYNISNVNLPSGVQTTGVYLRTAEHLQTNFMAHGPYLSGSWMF